MDVIGEDRRGFPSAILEEHSLAEYSAGDGDDLADLLPDDPAQLKALVEDLDRRLRNALSMVEAQRRFTTESMITCGNLRAELTETKRLLNLERMKNENFNKKKIKQAESVRYENIKQATSKAQEELRDEIIDSKIRSELRETKKLLRMRSKLEQMETIQDSQKLLLQQMSYTETCVEELATAAQNNDLDACLAHIRAGVNVNDTDSAGFLPLHYACSSGSLSVATLLLEQGSDCSSYLTGMSPIEIAAKNGHTDVIQLLHKFGASVEDSGAGLSPPIVSAAANNQLKSIEVLLSLGANIDAQDLRGYTALHAATDLENPTEVITFLLDKGATTLIYNRNGLTPLQMALMGLKSLAIAAFEHKSVNYSLSQEDTGSLTSSTATTLPPRATLNRQQLQGANLPSKRRLPPSQAKRPSVYTSPHRKSFI
jgi:ankyrin repeat protein